MKIIRKTAFTLSGFALLIFSGCTDQQLSQASQTLGGVLGNDNLTTQEVASGLKEALTKGISEGADAASKVDGYLNNPKIKIPLPAEVQNVEAKMRQFGLGSQVDRVITTLNRGAEEAAKEAKPIFISAIKSMTIQDAWSILRGEEDAATQYLQRATSDELKVKFQPVIQNALEQVNATRYYSDLVNSYNKIPGVTKLNPDLNEYATEKAMEGLFVLVAEEEENIRKNPAARTTELLERVFSQVDE